MDIDLSKVLSFNRGGKRVITAKYRETSGSDNAPNVALSVPTMTELASPPYPSAEQRPTRKRIAPVVPVKVAVGKEYDFVTTGVIAKIRVEKIWQEKDGNVFLVISQQQPQGRFTHALHMSEFKQRVLAGGVPEITI